MGIYRGEMSTPYKWSYFTLRKQLWTSAQTGAAGQPNGQPKTLAAAGGEFKLSKSAEFLIQGYPGSWTTAW